MQEENSAGVEKTKEGGLYLPFSFAQSPDQNSDKIDDTLFDIIKKNKMKLKFLSFYTKYILIIFFILISIVKLFSIQDYYYRFQMMTADDTWKSIQP